MFSKKRLFDIVKFIFISLFTCLIMTCNPGLGKAVDTQAPTVAIEYPATKSVLKGNFTMKGIASDEVKVTSCTVTFKNIKTTKEYKFPATAKDDKFSISVNTPKSDGSFELPDGDYNVTVSVSDAYRTSTADVVYTIDNTSPTVLITNPNAYISSNWPDMYKTITIKGEVYDANTISDVEVFIINKKGEKLLSQIADGTNTFSATFTEPAIQDGEYFYYAVAKDVGGNINTYCYHKYDIFDLLSSKSESSEKNIIFPSVTLIGSVDQGIEDYLLNEDIDRIKLTSKKIDNKFLDDNSVELSRGNYPGFNYYAKDTAKVKWLNITDDGKAGIGIGSPVLGTIMPPTDGSAIQYDSVKVYLVKSEDLKTFKEDFPTSENESSWADNKTKWILDSSVAKVGEEGEKQVKLTAVGESLNFQVDSHPVENENENWVSGYYKIRISFSTSTLTSFSDCIFTVSSGAPKITEYCLSSENPYASYYRGYMTPATKVAGKNFLIGQSRTSDGSSNLPISYTYLKTGELVENVGSIDIPSMENDEFKIEIPINTETHENDGEYTYTIKAEVATLSTVISRVVVVDTTNPVITFNTLENNKILPTKTYLVEGNITDTNGIDKVEYQLFADENQILLDGSSVASSGWILVPSAKSSFSLALSNLQKNKLYTLKLRATDIAGNVSGDDEFKCDFRLNSDNPVIKINSISPQVTNESGTSVNGTIKVKASISDTNSILSAYYTYDSSLKNEDDWAASGKATSFTTQEISNGIEISVDTTKFTDKTNLPLRIKVVDEAENSSIAVVDTLINQDFDKPVLNPSNFEKLANINDSGWTIAGAKNVFGDSNPNMIFTVSDDDLVKEYFAKVNDGEYKKVEDVNSAQKIVTYSVKDLSFGRHKITLKIVDSNYKNDANSPNSYVEETFYIAIDDAHPQLTLDNPNNQFVGSTFTLSGKVTDANGIESVTLQSSDGSVYSTLGLGSGLLEDGTFSYTFNLESMANRDPIAITAVDNIGNTSSTTFSYLVDSTEPTVEITGYSGAIDGTTPQTRIEGTARDQDYEPSSGDNGVSKIDQVRVKIGSSISGLNDPDAILATGKMIDNVELSWSAVLDFTGYDAGEHSVYVVAFDLAGNMSQEECITVSVDDDFPVFAHDYENNDVGEKTEAFEISGTVSDFSGVKEVSAYIQGTNRNLTPIFDASTGYWSFSVPEDVGDGHITIVVSATDNCKKTSSINLTATLDSKSPVIEFTNIDGNGTTKQTNSSPVVNISYSDETSGVATIEYEFWYKSSSDPEYAEFKVFEDENARGSINCNKATSGNLKLFMAGRTSSSNKGPFVDQESNTDGQWKVKYSIVDAAGHFIEGESPIFIVDRHSPKLDVTKPTANELKSENSELTVEGTVVDDYGGTIDRVVVKINHPKYSENERSSYTKTFTKEDGLVYNGSTFLYDWSVTWNESNSPFKYSDDYEVVVTAYDTAENQYEIKNKVSCDNSAPKITFIKPYSYSVDSYGNISFGETTNSPIGSTAVTASIEEFRMRSIFYQIGGKVVVSETGKGTDTYKITKVSVTNGGIQDLNEENVYENPSSEQGIPAGLLSGIWKKLGDANNGFTADIDTLKYFTEGKTVELLDDNPNNDANIIQTLEIHLVALDEAGNINYCAMPIKVDTDTDKPEVLVLSPKITNSIANVGGTTTISGTVSDDNNVHSVWMNVELVGGNYVGNILTQKGGNETFGVDYTQNDYGITNPQSITVDEVNKTFTLNNSDIDYFADRTKWYKVNLTEQAKSTTWNLMLNKCLEFDITSDEFKKYFSSDAGALEETTLNIRVVALDVKDGDANLSKSKLSDISAFTLKIDSGSPSIIIKNIDKIPVEGSYIGGTIDYDLTFTDDGSISYWEVSAKGSKGESIIASGNPNEGSYSEKISIDTEQINQLCGNVITLKIYVEDNSKDASGQVANNKTSEETFKYTIDNSAPIASIAETIDDKNYMITTESVVGDSTGAHRESADRGNHLRIKSQSALLSGKISDEVNGSGVDYVMLYFTKKINGVNYIFNVGKTGGNKTEITNSLSVKNDSGTEDNILFPLASFSDVKRNNNSLSTTNYIIIDKAEGLLDKGSNGDGDGYDENLRANGEWKVTVDSTNLADGIYDIYYVVVDVAGNARYYKDTMLVQNSAPVITSIVLSTDIDGDGDCEVSVDGAGEEDKLYDSSNFNTENNEPETPNTDFVVRNNLLKIRVNVVGGTQPLKYFMTYTNSSGSKISIEGTPSGNSSGIFTVTNFTDDGTASYTIWIEDSVEANLSLSSEKETIKLTLDNVDDVASIAQLFELNTDSSDKNSRGNLFTVDNVIQGHIEPRAYSPFDNRKDDAKNMDDPDVSGKIILRGEAYDNQRITSIVLGLPTGNVEIASWNDSYHTLLQKNEATLVKNELGLSGHYVEWSYVWDTNSIVAKNAEITVEVYDANPNNKSNDISYSNSNNVPRTDSNKFDATGWGYNHMTVDIVPYITGLSRNSSYVTHRTRSGAVPLLREEWSNRIEGFNLGSSSDTIVVKLTENKDGSGNKYDITQIAKPGTSLTTFQVPATAKDGYLTTTVNGIPSINNLNDNTQSYNKEGNEYQAETKYWTDDRYVRIWQDTDRFGNNEVGATGVILAQNPAYPAMDMDDSGNLYASFTNYSMHNVYYTTVNGNSTAVFNGYDSPEETTIFVTGTGDAPIVNVAYMANYQSGGSYDNWSANRADAGGLHLYDPKITSLGSEHFSDFRGYYMSRYELLYHDKQFQQFKNFRLVRKDANIDGYIHTAYYDIDTMSIHYSNISMNMYHVARGNFEASWVNIDGTYDEHDYAALNGTKDETKGTNIIADEAQNITLGMEYESDVFEDGLTRSSATGEYVGIDLTNDKHYPVLAYYDSVNQVVKLARANVENPKKSETNWTVQRVITNPADNNYKTTNGNYVDMQIDDEGYVHVVFVNGRGELIYVKSTNNPNDGNTAYTFGDSVVIAENSPMNVDITVRGETPYIGYLTSLGSFDGLNTAFYDSNLDLDNDGYNEGGWETMSAPLIHAVSNNRASVEAHPTPSSSVWESAHAYYSAGYYRVAYYIGSGKGH